MVEMMDNEIIWNDYDNYNRLKEIYEDIKLNKPNDGSKEDRAFAIILTDLEKVIAYYSMYIL